MSAGRFVAVMLLSLILGFAGFNLFMRAGLEGVRLDLTEGGLYRLSPGSMEVINRLDEPVSLTFYFSRSEAARYPALRAYGARVRELLRTLAARSGGRLQLEEIDPAPFSRDEDAALAAGLSPLAADDGGQIFFGLTARNAIDEARTIAFFDPAGEARLEYEIVRAVTELERARTPVIAIATSLPLAPARGGAPANPILAELAQTYELIWLDPDFDVIPGNADALFLIHPEPLDAMQAYLVDQFVLARGRVLAAVDPLSHYALKPGPDGLPPLRARRDSDLGALMSHWGVIYDINTVVMDSEAGLPVQIQEGGRTRMRAYPLWFSVPPAGLDRDLPAVAALSRGINLGSPGALAPAPGLEERFTALISTGPGAARLDVDRAAVSPSPEELMRLYAPAPDSPLVLGARVSGRFPSAFPDGPPAGEGVFAPGDHLGRSEVRAEIVILADTDLFDPAFFQRSDPVQGEQAVADNAALVLNLADWLAGDPALAGLRARASSARPMTRVERLRSEAEARYMALETALQTDLAEAEARLAELSRAGRASALGGAEGEEARVAEALRARIADSRDRLRAIERGFRVEIDALERALMFWTLWVPAGGVALAGLGFGLYRRWRRA
ncbi:MAG: Gldg family protein [Oceanicaulis sp.]|nr:Gldg family protein [Oceanicaulis sp.]